MTLEYDTAPETEGEETFAADDRIEPGDGGDLLSAWQKSRKDLLLDLVSGNVTNYSSYDIPAGIVENQSSPATVGFPDGENFHGTTIKGLALGPDGTGLSGAVKVSEDGMLTASKTISAGRFNISSPPRASVVLGDNFTGEGAATLLFIPDVSGLAYKDDVFSTNVDLGNVQYGNLNGELTTYDGDPVGGVGIATLTEGAVTDDDGVFNFLAPGGTTAEFKTLGGAITFEKNIPSGGEASVSLTLSQVIVEVLDAAFDPVANTRVEFDRTVYQTDEHGRVEINTLGPGQYDLTVQDYYERTVMISELGQSYQFTLSPGTNFDGWEGGDSLGGIEIEAIDAVSGKKIANISARDKHTGAISKSDGDGICKILSPDVNERVELVVGSGDKRYESTTIEGEVPKNDMIRTTVELTPRTVVTNT